MKHLLIATAAAVVPPENVSQRGRFELPFSGAGRDLGARRRARDVPRARTGTGCGIHALVRGGHCPMFAQSIPRHEQADHVRRS